MTQTFIVGSYNMQAKACRNNPNGVFNDIKRFFKEEGATAVVFQEGGYGKEIIARATKELNLYYYDGDNRKGQASTPVLSSKKIHDRKSTLLTPTTNVGPAGAGPNSILAKYLNMAKVVLFGRNVWVGSVHTTASIYIPKRFKMARKQIAGIISMVRTLRGIKLVGGDYNSLPNARLRRPLAAIGMRSTQKKLGPIGTHGARAIDDFHYWPTARNLVKPIRHWTVKGVSDHDAYFVEFEIKPSRKWSKTHKG